MIHSMTNWNTKVAYHFIWDSYKRNPIPFFMTIEDGIKAFTSAKWSHIEIGCSEYPHTQMHFYFDPTWINTVIKNVDDCAYGRLSTKFINQKQYQAMKNEIRRKALELNKV